MADLQGKDCRARVRLSNRADETLAEAGETCKKVPVESLAPLLASRKIELIGMAQTIARLQPGDPVTASSGLMSEAEREAIWADLGRSDEPEPPSDSNTATTRGTWAPKDGDT